MHRYSLGVVTGMFFLLPHLASAQTQAYAYVKPGELGRRGTHLVYLDLDLKKDSVVHIIGHTQVVNRGAGVTKAWSGINVDPDKTGEWWMARPSMENITVEETAPKAFNTVYAVRLPAGKHKIQWDFANMSGGKGPKVEVLHGGTLLLQIFEDTSSVPISAESAVEKFNYEEALKAQQTE